MTFLHPTPRLADREVAAALAAQGRLWLVRARLRGEVRDLLVEADEAAPWPGGALFFWNGGASLKDGRRTVLAFGVGEWFCVEPVTEVDPLVGPTQ